MKDPNTPIFQRKTLEAAMATNCTYYHGMSAQERFDVETPILLHALDNLLREAENVMDYGVGVGRVAKAILENYPHVQIIGIDNSENMLDHARRYVPRRYFEDGRIVLYTPEQIEAIKKGSIDLALAVYVLQHVDDRLLAKAIHNMDVVINDSGNLYVLNSKRRAVPRIHRIEMYEKVRRILWFLESYSTNRQVQRIAIKLDNRLLLHDDGVDVRAELEKVFLPSQEAPLSGNPHIERLMKGHFSLLYKKRSRD